MRPLGGSRAFGCTESSPSHLERKSEQVERGSSHFGGARTVSGRAHRNNNRRQLGEAGNLGQCFLMLRLTTLTPMRVMTHCPQYSIPCFYPFAPRYASAVTAAVKGIIVNNLVTNLATHVALGSSSFKPRLDRYRCHCICYIHPKPMILQAMSHRESKASVETGEQ